MSSMFSCSLFSFLVYEIVSKMFYSINRILSFPEISLLHFHSIQGIDDHQWTWFCSDTLSKYRVHFDFYTDSGYIFARDSYLTVSKDLSVYLKMNKDVNDEDIIQLPLLIHRRNSSTSNTVNAFVWSLLYSFMNIEELSCCIYW